MSDFYDLFDEAEIESSEEIKPFHTVAKDKDEKVLQWLNDVSESLIRQGEQRSRQQRENMFHYRGVSVRRADRNRDYVGKRFNKIQRLVVNHLFDLTETKVSQMNRLKPAVEILPTNEEWEDRSAARVCDLLIKHLWNLNNVDHLMQKQHRQARIFGESYIFIDWDSSKGDLHPMYVKARDLGINELEIDGESFDLDKPVKTGDLIYDLEVPWRVLLQRKCKFEDVEYLFRIRLEETESLKLRYPKKKLKIKKSDDLREFDVDNLSGRLLEEHTIVFEFHHIGTEHLDEGAYIKFTKDCILERGEHKFTHKKLPCIRLTDMDVPDILNGVSKYEMIIPIQEMINNGETLIAKNIYLTAHAKWMMPRGACKIEQLGNDNTIVQFQGPVAPQLVQHASNAPEVYQWVDGLKQKMQTIYGSHGISRGEVPKGITAASALQFLNELENERATTDIAKHGFMVKDLAKMSLAVAGDKYDINDGRMVRIVGENNKFLIRHFDTANLNKNYDIRIDLSTGLPETKSARYQRVLDALQRNPQMLSPERWEELLEFGNEKKMQSLISEAVRSADSENEDLMSGEPVGLPEEWEDHIVHWEAHVRHMQSRAFKEEATPEVRKAFKEHLKIHEEAMFLKMQTSPQFEAHLARLKTFPIFHHAQPSPKSAEHQEAMVQGQANRGEPISGQIPGQDSNQIEAAIQQGQK